jgi:hypothetical protein
MLPQAHADSTGAIGIAVPPGSLHLAHATSMADFIGLAQITAATVRAY